VIAISAGWSRSGPVLARDARETCTPWRTCSYGRC